MMKTIQVVDTFTGLALGNIEHAKLGAWLANSKKASPNSHVSTKGPIWFCTTSTCWCCSVIPISSDTSMKLIACPKVRNTSQKLN